MMKGILAGATAALLAVSGANATVYQQIYKGTVTDSDPAFSTDYDNLVGGGDLAGASYTATFLWDDTLGTTVIDATSRDTYGSHDPFDPASPPTPNLLASLTINGKTFSIVNAEYGEIYSIYDSFASQMYSNSVTSGYQLSFSLFSFGFAPFGAPSWNYAGFEPISNLNGGALFSQGDELRMNITYYSIAPVSPTAAPEPAAWAMMLGGFGMIGGVMRTRRRIAIAFA